MALPRRRVWGSLAATIAMIAWCAEQVAWAGPNDKNPAYDRQAPVLLKADEVTYDEDHDTVTARGHVEMSQSERVLLADTVSYNRKTGIVTASGNVSVMQPSGDVIFADYVELTDQMKDGFIKDVRILLSDNARLAGNSATRVNDNITTVDRAVYSPCEVCKDHPDHPPLWQVKAFKVIHNEEQQRIEYKDATLEMWGVPVAYTPYFSHPDPTVKRKSGFLAPSFGNDSNLGTVAKIPYYWTFSPTSDLIVEPEIFGATPPLLFTQYRQRTDTGRYVVDASLTRGDAKTPTGVDVFGQELRGHIFATGRFNVDDTWKWGFDAARATDNTYLQRYRFSTANTLTSDAFVQGFHDRSYTELNSFAFQGLLPQDNPGTSPLVLPLAQYQYVGEPQANGSYYTFDANGLDIYRTRGQKTRRFSSTLGWTLPYIGSAGDVYTLHAQMRGDAYWVTPGLDPTGSVFVHDSGGTGRAEPLVSVEWRYPMVRPDGSLQEVIEPIVQAIASPYGGNPNKVPNEDSRNFEFDDTNVFSINRFPGVDRYEGGPRINYGLHGAVYGLSGGYGEFLIGQTARLRNDATFPIDTGLDKQISDIVGRITVAPSALLDVTNRFRVDRNNLRIHRNEISVSAGPNYANLRVTYAQIDNQLSQTQFGNRQELIVGASSQLTREWSLFGTWRRDLSEQNVGTLDTGAGLRYLDECFEIQFTIERTNIRLLDIQPSTSFGVKVNFRNFG
ncbi:MAG TPA: LPS assembly protein LptD [Candidatus Cybelea sp.]|nr:LPS assembly protein LptD [Candidatus Cybelea sp.]